MTILIVENDPSLQEILAELVTSEIAEAEIVTCDNLDDAVRAIHALPAPAAILADGMFPTWSREKMGSLSNPPRPNWIGVIGWAVKKHIPVIVLTGAAEVAEHARRVGVPAYLKPQETHAAIAHLCRLVLPAAVRENPVIAEVDATNKRLGNRRRKPKDAVVAIDGEADATGEP